MSKIIEKSSEYLAIFAGFLIFIMCILSTYEAISRTIFNSPTAWTLSISVFLMIYAIFLSSAYCFLKDAHIRIELVLDKLGEVKRRILLVFGYLLCIVTIIVLGWRGLLQTIRSFENDWLTQTAVQIPIGYVNIAIPIGCFFMILALFVLLTKKNKIGVK